MRSRVIETFLPDIPAPSEQTAAYKIFNYDWDIFVPHMFVYSDEYIRQAGTLISDPAYDAELPSQMVGGRYKIVDMAVLLDEGAQLRLNNPVDAKTIYDIVSQHLEDWSQHLLKTGSFDHRNAPLDDLMKLSQLADHLYGFAARYFTHEAPRGKLARRLDQLRGRIQTHMRAGQPVHRGGRHRVVVDENAPPEQAPVMRHHNESTQNILEKGGGGRNGWS
ncbi:hypothetical protein [Xanthomonas phage RTH11]|nr:hypothetical protein [Xanthomonas phage RTH11]